MYDATFLYMYRSAYIVHHMSTYSEYVLLTSMSTCTRNRKCQHIVQHILRVHVQPILRHILVTYIAAYTFNLCCDYSVLITHCDYSVLITHCKHIMLTVHFKNISWRRYVSTWHTHHEQRNIHVIFFDFVNE